MRRYLYPQNLKASANVWLWSLRDLAIFGVAILISVLIASVSGILLPLAVTLGYGFLSIRLDDTTVVDYIRYATRYLFATQQYFEWR